MIDVLLAWLATHGIATRGDLTPLKRGLGSNEIWKLERGDGEPPLVLRLFAAGRSHDAEREAAAMRTALAGGIPAPEVVATGNVGDRPLLVTSFAPGRLVTEVLLGSPDLAETLGTRMGQTLGTLHHLSTADVPGTRNWIDLGGEAIAPLRAILATAPDQDRLLHLDYHPLNVLVDADGTVTGVIDWENASQGPPHADLARTSAIIRMTTLANLLPPGAEPVVEAFHAALVAEHDGIVGPSPLPAALSAWGLAMTSADLAPKAGLPGNPITREAVALLEAERDAAIATALG